MGLHWKMNSDLTPIPGLGNPYPNDDALSGYLMYSLVQHAVVSTGHTEIPSLHRECEELGKVARMYVNSGVVLSCITIPSLPPPPLSPDLHKPSNPLNPLHHIIHCH